MTDKDTSQSQAAACDWSTMERDFCQPPPQPPCNVNEPICTPAKQKRIDRDPEFNFHPKQIEPIESSKPQRKILGERVSDRNHRFWCQRNLESSCPPQDPGLPTTPSPSSPLEREERKRASSAKQPDVILFTTDEKRGEGDPYHDNEYEGESDDFQIWFNDEFGEYEEKEYEGEDEGSEGDAVEDEAEQTEEQEGSDSEEDDGEDSWDEECIFTEAELRFLIMELPQRKWSSTFCLERMLSILTTPYLSFADANLEEATKHFDNRLIILWKFYRRRSPSGILLPDVKLLMDIVLVLGREFRHRPFSSKLIARIERHYLRGIRIRKMGDKNFLKTLIELFTTIGQVMETTSKSVAGHAITILTKLTKATLRTKSCIPPKLLLAPIPPESENCDTPIRIEDFLFALEHSHLPAAILRRFAAPETVSKKLYTKLLKLLCLMTDRSNKICEIAVGFPIIEPMLMKLSSKGKKRNIKILCQTIKIIYKMFVNPNIQVERLCTSSPCSIEAFRILLSTFLERTRMISSKYLVHLRNDVAFVILLLIRQMPELRGGFEGYAQLIAGIVTCNVSSDVAPDAIVLDGSSDDFEFLKTLVWILKFILESDIRAESLVRNYRLVAAFMRLLMGPCDLVDTYAEHGETSDLDDMFTITWNCLSVIAHKFPKCFQEPEGIEAMLDTLEIFAEHGQTDISLVALFLDICRALLIQQDEPMVPFMDSKGGMEVFTRTLKRLTEHDWAMSDEPIISNALMCCSLMSSHNEQQREIFMDNNGVKLLLRLLNRLVYAPPHKRHMNSVIHISVADCIWQCLAESPSCLESFLHNEGMFRILELLEIAAGPGAQLHILSCILELCEYPRCVDQLLYWKRRVRDDIQRLTHGQDFNLQSSSIASVQKISPGDKMGEILRDQDLSLSALLCELWREEEERLGVKRDKEGVIASIKEPLMTSFAREYAYSNKANYAKLGHPAEGNTNGPASLDLLNSIRPKIFLLVKKLTDATNTEATIYGGLGIKNQVTMQIITNMLDMKRGEIWLEIVDRLMCEGIKVVETDRQALELYFKVAQNKVAVVIDTQRYLIRRAKEDAEMKERQFYNAIKTCHLQDHLQALKEAEYHARTSNYFLLIDKRLWQKAQIQRAILNIDSNARVHRTMDDTLNITTWIANRKKYLESEPQFNTVGFDEEQTKREAERYGLKSKTSDIDPDAEAVSKFKKHEYRFTSSTAMLRTGRGLIQSPMKSVNDTPEPHADDTGVDPLLLQKALHDYLKELRQWNWKNASEDPEEAWRVRTKWRSDWYH